jgi:hypothetical protein
MRRYKTSLYIAFWGTAGALWMACVLHTVWLRGAIFTDYVGFWSAHYLPRFRGLAPISDVYLFNAWMIATSAVQWMILGWLVRRIAKRLSKRAWSSHQH